MPFLEIYQLCNHQAFSYPSETGRDPRGLGVSKGLQCSTSFLGAGGNVYCPLCARLLAVHPAQASCSTEPPHLLSQVSGPVWASLSAETAQAHTGQGRKAQALSCEEILKRTRGHKAKRGPVPPHRSALSFLSSLSSSTQEKKQLPAHL